jgi:hypothetical protein
MLFEVLGPQKANNINLGTFFTRNYISPSTIGANVPSQPSITSSTEMGHREPMTINAFPSRFAYPHASTELENRVPITISARAFIFLGICLSALGHKVPIITGASAPKGQWD